MPRHQRQVQIVWGHKTTNLDEKIDDIIPWVRESGRPYYDAFFDGVDTDEIIDRWLRRRSSELSLRRTRLAVADDRIAGGYIALPGSEVAGCRQADLLDLARSIDDHSYSDLRDRMRGFSDLFAPVDTHDFYLSKIGTRPEIDDRELEIPLMEDCLSRAEHGGFGRVRIDVPEDDEDSRGFYETYGFRPIHRGKDDQGRLCYLSMVCNV